MLRRLSVREFAVIAKLDLELHPGLTVFSGETGAGKSILVGALALILGERARRGLVRAGAERAEVVLEADPDEPAALRDWLAEHDFDDSTFLLRRVLRSDGTSRAYINDTQVSVRTLREAASLLIEIHGQHEHQKLTERAQQRMLLDAACDHPGDLGDLADCHRRWQELRERLAEAESGMQERAQERELVERQTEELEALAPREGEYEELDTWQRQAATAAERLQTCTELLAQLRENEEHALGAQLSRAAAQAQAHAEYAPGLKAATELLEQARICVDEAADAAAGERDRTDLDPARAAEVEQRLQGFFDLARRHGMPPAMLWQKLDELRLRREALADSTQDPQALADELERIEQDYRSRALTISQRRAKTADQVSKKASRILRRLGMPHAVLAITVAHDAEREPGPSGTDDIEFRIATAPQQEPGPIAQLASGGELSRLSLTLRLVLRGGDAPPVMIFDEVDTGIGGGPAEQVGRMLAELAGSAQVLCITHLPQVAVQGHRHFCVRKNEGARTEILVVDRDERVNEIARMFSGIEKMRTAREHARALLAHAREQGPA